MNRRSQVRHSSNRLINFFLAVMLILAAVVVWKLVPLLANDLFEAPSQYLTKSQLWNYSLQLVLHQKELTSANCEASQPVSLTIKMGDSINQITGKLITAGVIGNATAFQNYLIYKGIDTNIRAGDYSLSCTETPIKIADEIENHTQESVEFDILPGWRAEEIANALTSSGIEITPSDFLKIVLNRSKGFYCRENIPLSARSRP
jgi:UPF0755 protein